MVSEPGKMADHNSHSHTDPKESVLISPAVRILLETYHLNPRLIPATGPKGRLLKGDVLRYVAQEGKPFTKPGEAEVTTKTAKPTTPLPLATPLQPAKSEGTGRGFKILFEGTNGHLNLEDRSYRNCQQKKWFEVGRDVVHCHGPEFSTEKDCNITVIDILTTHEVSLVSENHFSPG